MTDPLPFPWIDALFVLALTAGWSIGVPYFLWLGIFNLMVIAQFWAFAADLYTPDGASRTTPAPAVLTTNGFGGSKDDQAGTGHAGARRRAARARPFRPRCSSTAG